MSKIWTKEEDSLIKETISKFNRIHSLKYLNESLTNRSLRSIKRRIKILCGGILDRWANEEIEKLKEIYQRNKVKDFNKMFKKELPNRNIDSCYHKASQLKIVRKDWSEKENNLVESWAGLYTPESIQKMLEKRGYKRTIEAVRRRFQIKGWSLKRDVFSAKEVADGLGCSSQRVTKWILNGSLPGEQREKNKIFEIKPRDVAQFIRKFPFEINKFKPDIPWIVALLDEFKKEK